MLRQRSRLSLPSTPSRSKVANAMETNMKTIMGALGLAGLLLAGAAAPASADIEEMVEIVREHVQLPRSDVTSDIKIRRYMPEQIEHLADELPVGSSEWWQQMDRERRGGRR